jgi:hypothetical protein
LFVKNFFKTTAKTKASPHPSAQPSGAFSAARFFFFPFAFQKNAQNHGTHPLDHFFAANRKSPASAGDFDLHAKALRFRFASITAPA